MTPSGAGKGTATTLQRSYPGDTALLNQARHDIADALRTHGLVNIIDDAELVLSELASNAVEASPDEPFDVCVVVTSDTVAISVTNTTVDTPESPVPPAAQWGPEAALASHGRGLLIVQALSTSVDVQSERGAVTITAHLAIDR